MSVNLASGVIPFTELFERLMTLAKIDSFNNEDYAKGLINDAYTRVIPGMEDWQPLISEGSLSMSAYYNTGTVSVSAGSTSLSGVGTAWTAAMTAALGWKIKFAGNENVYSFTRTGDTNATISPALSGATDLSGASYVLYREEYVLASDFDRFLKGGSIYIMSGGRTQDIIEELPRDKFREDATSDPSDPIRRCMLTGMDSSGYRKVRVNPPPRTAKVYPYEYVPKIAPMREYTIGTVTVTSASAVVTGVGTAWNANVAAGMYFRIDSVGTGDSSKWHKILSVDSNTQITLDAVYGDIAESASEYTISASPTALPSEFHEFILYDAVAVAVASQTDPNSQILIARRQDVETRLKKNYKSRRVNQQFKVEDDGYR